MAYRNETGTFASSKDGFELFWQKWLPAENPRRVVVIQHGFGEHSGRYGNVLKAFENDSTAFYALDSRGHGHSPGKRGHVDQFQQYVDDLGDLVQIARKENGGGKVFLLGHSLGGLISLQYALESNNQDNLVGLALSSAFLKMDMDLEKKIKKGVAGLFVRFMPAVTMDANLDVTNISHDPEVVKAYEEDPLVHGKVSFQMGVNSFALGEVLISKAHRLTIPTLVWTGTDDRIVSPDGSRELFAALQTQDKTFQEYPGLYHETMNEAGEAKWEVLADLKTWLDKH